MPDLVWFEAHTPEVYEPAEDTFLLLDVIHSQTAALVSMEPRLVVEVGPGAGAVSAFLAASLGESTAVLAIDINPDAVRATLATARDNGVEGRVAAVEGNLLSSLPTLSATTLKGEPAAASAVASALDATGHKADVIVFNPPYVPTPDEEVDASLIARAWAGGLRGRRVIDRFLPELAGSLSKPGGVAFMIVVRENLPRDIAAAAAGLGLVTVGVASSRAHNERLSVIKFRWPGDAGRAGEDDGMPLLGEPGAVFADEAAAVPESCA